MRGYFTDKVVMITGASSGLGKGMALEIAARGGHLGLLARREDLLKEIVEEIRNVKAVFATADVRDAKAVREAADRFRKELGPIDILIANAGIGTADHATSLTPEHAANVIGINVLGAINSVAAVLPEMVERKKGRLVAISSLAAYRGLAKSAAYCASKAALSAYFESLRIDLRHAGVGVTTIHPGFIKTDLTAGRHSKMPYLMELDDGVRRIINAIEKEKKTYAFPWQLATIVRATMMMPAAMYDWIAERNSFRE
ncbi:MAG TPA: SDR family NAD(P)-dependent oxidoreductase [Pyrinomonadaceae bacterium]|nr:SDR family NAD(P)-dependent oxidoreductase [Pyrinomonadaceae bacterium]